MDPLSIAASTITLIDASAKLIRFFKSIRHATSGYEALCKELSTLNGYVESIRTTLNECQRNPLTVSSIDQDLWRQSRVALTDCDQTLEELAGRIQRIKAPTRSNTLFRKARIAAEMQLQAREICSFRDKLNMSNLSLQTLLQVITVSLTLRNNTSQETTLRELRQLNKYLDRSYRAATDPMSTVFFTNSDKHLAHNLKDLVRAARDFHSSASTTASTIYGGVDRRASIAEIGDYDAQSGIIPRFSAVRMRQIETFLAQNEHDLGAESITHSVEAPIVVNEEAYPEVVVQQTQFGAVADASASPSTSSFDLDFDRIFFGGLSKIAQRAIRRLDLAGAERNLQEALARHKSSGLDDLYHRRLRIQLVLVNFFQKKGREMEASILDLAEFHEQNDPVTRQLLYALALAYAHENDSRSSQKICKRLWQALRGSDCSSAPQKREVLQLLAVSYSGSGELLLTEAIGEEFPTIEFRGTLPTVVDFITSCDELLVELFSVSNISSIPRMVVVQIQHGTNVVAELADTAISLPMSPTGLSSPGINKHSRSWSGQDKKTRKFRRRPSANMLVSGADDDTENTGLLPRLASMIRKARTGRRGKREPQFDSGRNSIPIWLHSYAYHESPAAVSTKPESTNSRDCDHSVPLGPRRRFSFEGTHQEPPTLLSAIYELESPGLWTISRELEDTSVTQVVSMDNDSSSESNCTSVFDSAGSPQSRVESIEDDGCSGFGVSADSVSSKPDNQPWGDTGEIGNTFSVSQQIVEPATSDLTAQRRTKSGASRPAATQAQHMSQSGGAGYVGSSSGLNGHDVRSDKADSSTSVLASAIEDVALVHDASEELRQRIQDIFRYTVPVDNLGGDQDPELETAPRRVRIAEHAESNDLDKWITEVFASQDVGELPQQSTRCFSMSLSQEQKHVETTGNSTVDVFEGPGQSTLRNHELLNTRGKSGVKALRKQLALQISVPIDRAGSTDRSSSALTPVRGN